LLFILERVRLVVIHVNLFHLFLVLAFFSNSGVSLSSVLIGTLVLLKNIVFPLCSHRIWFDALICPSVLAFAVFQAVLPDSVVLLSVLPDESALSLTLVLLVLAIVLVTF